MIVSAEYEPAAVGFGEKNLLTLAPGKLTKVCAVGSKFVTPFRVVTAPAAIVLVRLPFTVIVTFSVNVQFPNGDRLPPLKEKELAPEFPLRVPPQVPTSKFTGLARIIPGGMSSVKVMPASETLPGFVSLILIVEAEPPKTVSGEKPFTRAIERLPLPVTVKAEVKSPVGTRFSVFVILAGGMVLVCKPNVVPVTYTSILQRCPARIKPPVREMEVAPVGAVNTSGGVGPQPVIAGGVELLTVTPAGKLSVIEKFVRLVLLGAKKSILNREFSPTEMLEGKNDFVPERSVPLTVTAAVAAVRLPTPWAVVRPPGGIVFVNDPEGVPAGAVTGTEIVQVPGVVMLPAGMTPPVKVTLVAVVVTVPGGTQVLVAAPLTVNGLGKLSVTFTPV